MKKEYDVIIAGAGAAGITAALTAARRGLRVLLIDKNGYPGGMNTAAMICPLMTFHAGKCQIIKGIAQEIIDRLAQKGATLGHIPDPIGMASTITPIDTEALKIVYFELLSEEKNITLLLSTWIEDVTCTERCLKNIMTVNKSGKNTYAAKVFIDATGDGDIASMCHTEFELGRDKDGMAQPMTQIFALGGVDFLPVIDYMEKNPEQFILNIDCDLKKYVAVSGFFDLVTRARCAGDFSLPRDRVLFFQGVYPGEVLVNMSRVTERSGINAEDITFAQIEAHRQIQMLVFFFKKYIPGFKNCHIQKIAPAIGVRESRRIVGMETLTTEAVIHSSENKNSVAMCAFPIDIHDPVGNELNWIRKEKSCCYDIPYGVMVPERPDNLLVTGRCISATHEALASARITATVMALGQAAGNAAVSAIQKDCAFSAVDPAEIQKNLVLQGAVPGKHWLKNDENGIV